MATNDGIPPPNRTATLESGKSGPVHKQSGVSNAFSRFWETASNDLVEDILLSLEGERWFFHATRYFYRRLKYRCRSELLRHVVRIISLPLTTSPGERNEEAGDEAVYLSTSDNISQSFERIYGELKSPKSSLRMCFVSKGTFTGKSPYSAASYIRMMLMDSWVHDCYGVFRGVVLSLLIDAWAADWDDGQLITSLLIQDDPLHWQPSWYSIPEDILPNMQPAHPASMLCYLSDPEVYDWDKAFYLRFVWPRQWPRYDGDVDVYVRQPYSRKPALDYVDILALKDPDPPSSNRKLIVVASSPEVLERVVTSQYLSRMPSTRAPDVYAQILRFFCNLCNLILEDMLVFKAGVERSVEAIDRCRRKSPSGLKIQYLLHLEECIASTEHQIQRNNAILDRIEASWAERSCSIEPVLGSYLQDLQTLKGDFTLLLDELSGQQAISKSLRGLIKDQMEYSNKVRNNIIGILVAIYVPLSFATSLYDMNISDHSPAEFNTTVSTRQGSHWNSTLTTTSTTQPVARTWSSKTVATTAVPLTVCTVIIPVAIGPLFRGLSRYSETNPGDWRAMKTFCALGLAGGFCVLTYYRAPMDILPRIILTTPWMLSYLFLALRPEPRRWIVVLFWASCVVWNFICYLGGAWVQTSSMASICLALIIASLRGSITERENMIAQRREQSQRFRKWRKRLAKKAEHET